MRKLSAQQRIQKLDKLATKLHLYSLAIEPDAASAPATSTSTTNTYSTEDNADVRNKIWSEINEKLQSECGRITKSSDERIQAYDKGIKQLSTSRDPGTIRVEMLNQVKAEIRKSIYSDSQIQKAINAGQISDGDRSVWAAKAERIVDNYIRKIPVGQTTSTEPASAQAPKLQTGIGGTFDPGAGPQSTENNTTMRPRPAPKSEKTPKPAGTSTPTATRPAGTGGKYKSIDPNMQRALGVTPDGVWGPETQRAIERKRAELKQQYPGTTITDQIVFASLMGQAPAAPAAPAPVTSFQPVTPTPFNPNEP